VPEIALANRFEPVIPHSPVNMLLIETSTSRTLSAVLRDDGRLFEAVCNPTQRHASGLVPSIQRVIEAAGISLASLHGIAVGIGPGSFTGLRVGLTAAKILSHTLGCRLLAVESLQIIAAGVEKFRQVLAVADAQRGTWYVARYEAGTLGELPRLVRPIAIEHAIEIVEKLGPDVCVAGPGLERWPANIVWPDSVARAEFDLCYPSASGMARCGLAAWSLHEWANPVTLEPLYIRSSAAEERQVARA
jgi:tRNA threonylcarbamoyladenosine biosynthesis protein TsaB